VNCQA